MPELLADSHEVKDIPERLYDWRILERTFDIISYQIQSNFFLTVRLCPSQKITSRPRFWTVQMVAN